MSVGRNGNQISKLSCGNKILSPVQSFRQANIPPAYKLPIIGFHKPLTSLYICIFETMNKFQESNWLLTDGFGDKYWIENNLAED